jgi:signal transduction histidine kinase
LSTLKPIRLIICLILLSFSTEISKSQSQLAEKEIGDSTRVMNLYLDAFNIMKAGEVQAARNMVLKADSLSKVLNFEYGMIFSNVRQAQIFNTEQKYDSARYIIQKALQDYPEAHPKIEADLYNTLGTALSRQGEMEQSLQSYKSAQTALAKLDSARYADYNVGLNLNIGQVLSSMGNLTEATEAYIRVLEYAQTNQDSTLLAVASLNIGTVYTDQNDPNKATYYLQKAIEVSQAIGYQNYVYLASINLANVNVLEEKYQSARDLYARAYELHQKFAPDRPAAHITYNLGWLNAEMGNYGTAETYYLQSIDEAKTYNISEYLYESYTGLGNLYKTQKRFEESISPLMKGYRVVQEMETPVLIAEAEFYLYESYKEAGRFEQALHYRELHEASEDSISVKEQEQKLAQLESQLELNRQNQINRLLEEKQQEQEARIQFQQILIIAGAIILILIIALLYISNKSTKEKEKLLEELKDRKDELEEMNKAKDQVFAMVSHDLRSPLTSVQGVLDLIRDDMLKGEDLKRLIDGIEVSVRENVNVIEDLLAWAKDQLSGFDLEPQSMKLKPLLDDVLTTQTFLALQKKIELKKSINGQTIFADPNAMRVIIRNLISNAIKYTHEEGKIELTVEENNQHVLISIKDNGIGIPESVKDKIFDSNSWTRAGTGKEKGSGFGLSMTKEFVERMNGRIWFESTEGNGTSFFVELPKAD